MPAEDTLEVLLRDEARHKKQGQLRSGRTDLLRELRATHAGHGNVGEKQVDLTGTASIDLQGCLSAQGVQCSVSVLGEEKTRQVAEIGIIIHDEDGDVLIRTWFAS